MSHTITAAQRDALYDQILDRLSGIGDIELAIRSENYTAAERLGREYSDDLRLLLDGLGIGDGNGDPFELTASPEVLRRVLPRLRKLARNHTASLEPELIEASDIAERNRLVSEACEAVLAGLDGAETPNVPMGLFRRLRQACRGDLRRPADAGSVGTCHRQGSGASKGAFCGHSPLAGAASALQGQDSPLALNRLFISGVLVADPLTDKGRNDDRVTLLLLAFPAPDPREAEERLETASCEVEVPERVSEKHGRTLQAGESVFITGQLSGGGGVIATELHSGPPPEQDTRREAPSEGGPP